MRLLIIIALVAGLSFCAPAFRPSYPTLSDQGILGLSTTNAYLASNLFLGREAERSTYLYNFLKAKGAPTAIEIMEQDFPRPRLLLFYPSDREVYFSEPELVDQRPQWITRGPFPIEWRDYRTLGALNNSMVGEAVFLINGEIERFKFHGQARKPERVLLPALAPTPVATLAKKPKVKPIVVKPAKVEDPDVPGINNWKPMNADQLALYMAKGYAERDDNGDVLHLVMGTKENLSAISKWYTGSAVNTKALATLNIVAETEIEAPLLLGRKIRIPVSMLKELKAMPPVN